MAVIHNKTDVGNGIYLVKIKDDKFKYNVIKLEFITKKEKKSIVENNILFGLLSMCNSEIPSMSEFSDELSSLYGTLLGPSLLGCSDYQVAGLGVSFIDDKYTIGSENISDRVAKIFLDCLFSPNLPNGKFDENYFKQKKQELVDDIHSLMNNKSNYAFLKAREVIFQGEPFALNNLGTIEDVERVTQEDLLNRLEYIKKSGVIRITVSGGGDLDKAAQTIVDRVRTLKRENVEQISYEKFSPLKPEPLHSEEKLDVKQSKLVMAYKTDSRDIYGCKIFDLILGGTPFSKLFTNVREKLSLCYYCSARYNDFKGTIMIESGVETEDIQKAIDAITNQIELVQQGDFTEEELYNTKLLQIGAFRSNNDSLMDIISWYETQNNRNTDYSPEEMAEIIMDISAERVIECAKSFKPDTVYVLKAVGEEQCDE